MDGTDEVIRTVPPLNDLPGWGVGLGHATFCHWRTSKSGHRRLVITDSFSQGIPATTVWNPGAFNAPPTVISTNDWTDPPTWNQYEVLSARPGLFYIGSWLSNDPIFTLFAGQADPENDSHFTFRYFAKGQEGTIDAWLLDNDKVRFRAIDGPYGHPLAYFQEKEAEFDN